MDGLTIPRFFNSFVRLVLLIFPSAFNCIHPYILPERPASNNSVELGLVSWLMEFLAASLSCGHEKNCFIFVLAGSYALVWFCLFVVFFWSWLTIKK